MSFVDKFKKILFDDVDDSEELPERAPKAKKEPVKSDSRGFIEYHNEEEEENPIREIKIPQEEKVPQKVEEQIDKFNFPIDTEFDVPETKIPTRQRNYEDMDINFLNDEPEEEIKLVKEVNSFTTTPKDPVRRDRDTKDYRKILEESSKEVKEKKPFTNTPVISPVWGILDKNYKPEEIVDRTDALTKVNTGAVPRTYGPVSYNDQPLVQKKKPQKLEKTDVVKEPQKKISEKKIAQTEELIELNTAITDLINEPIEEEKEEIIKTPLKKAKKEVRKTPIEEENDVPTHSIDDIDDDIIQTDNYDEIESVDTNLKKSSIEDSENDNNNIEDAFESTSEFDSIRENDTVEESPDEDDDEAVDMESIISRPDEDESEDDEGLDNTIETDLFNLIDSMYKDEDE